MITQIKTYEIECENCPHSRFTISTKFRPEFDIQQELESRGWIEKDGCYFCKSCQREEMLFEYILLNNKLKEETGITKSLDDYLKEDESKPRKDLLEHIWIPLDYENKTIDENVFDALKKQNKNENMCLISFVCYVDNKMSGRWNMFDLSKKEKTLKEMKKHSSDKNFLYWCSDVDSRMDKIGKELLIKNDTKPKIYIKYENDFLIKIYGNDVNSELYRLLKEELNNNCVFEKWKGGSSFYITFKGNSTQEIEIIWKAIGKFEEWMKLEKKLWNAFHQEGLVD